MRRVIDGWWHVTAAKSCFVVAPNSVDSHRPSVKASKRIKSYGGKRLQRVGVSLSLGSPLYLPHSLPSLLRPRPRGGYCQLETLFPSFGPSVLYLTSNTSRPPVGERASVERLLDPMAFGFSFSSLSLSLQQQVLPSLLLRQRRRWRRRRKEGRKEVSR